MCEDCLWGPNPTMFHREQSLKNRCVNMINQNLPVKNWCTGNSRFRKDSYKKNEYHQVLQICENDLPMKGKDMERLFINSTSNGTFTMSDNKFYYTFDTMAKSMALSARQCIPKIIHNKSRELLFSCYTSDLSCCLFFELQSPKNSIRGKISRIFISAVNYSHPSKPSGALCSTTFQKDLFVIKSHGKGKFMHSLQCYISPNNNFLAIVHQESSDHVSVLILKMKRNEKMEIAIKKHKRRLRFNDATLFSTRQTIQFNQSETKMLIDLENFTTSKSVIYDINTGEMIRIPTVTNGPFLKALFYIENKFHGELLMVMDPGNYDVEVFEIEKNALQAKWKFNIKELAGEYVSFSCMRCNLNWLRQICIRNTHYGIFIVHAACDFTVFLLDVCKQSVVASFTDADVKSLDVKYEYDILVNWSALEVLTYRLRPGPKPEIKIKVFSLLPTGVMSLKNITAAYIRQHYSLKDLRKLNLPENFYCNL